MIRRPVSKKRISLVVVDLAIVVGSILLASIIRIGFHGGLGYVEANYFAFLVTGIIYIFAFYISGLYDFRKDFRTPNNLFAVACTSIVAFIVVSSCFYVNWSLRLGRGVFILNGLLITIFLVSWRYVYSYLAASPKFQRKVLIVGAGWAGRTICDVVRETKSYGLNVIGFIDDDESKVGVKYGGKAVLGGRSDLMTIVKEHNVGQVVVAITHEKHKDLLRALIRCSQDGVVVTDMPTLYESLTGKIPFDHIDDLWFLNSLARQSVFHVQAIKRCADIIFSIVILTVFLPILPLIAVLIVRGSRGGVFYVQERVGHNGENFNIIKFRTMIHNAEAKTGAVYASDKDGRVTGVGRFLRKWRLDEIPQLLNVIKGNMSLVGPRPERPVFVSKYLQNIPFYVERLSARPGITGWAQVKFQYASSVEHTEEKLQYDLYYVKNLSFTLDIIILLQTVKVVLFGRGK